MHFTWLTPPGPYWATTCRERDHIHNFLTTQGHWGPLRFSDQLNTGATSEKTLTLKTIHTIHSHIHSNKADMIRVIIMAKWYSGNHVGLKLPGICHIGEEKPRKNLTKETYRDRRSNPGPLRDKRACYHLLHSGVRLCTSNINQFYFISHVKNFYNIGILYIYIYIYIYKLYIYSF